MLVSDLAIRVAPSVQLGFANPFANVAGGMERKEKAAFPPCLRTLFHLKGFHSRLCLPHRGAKVPSSDKSAKMQARFEACICRLPYPDVRPPGSMYRTPLGFISLL